MPSASELRKMARQLREWNKWRRGVGKYALTGCEPPGTPREFGWLLEECAEVLERLAGKKQTQEKNKE